MSTPVAGDVLRFIRRYSTKPAPDSAFETLAARVFRFQFEKNVLYRRFCEMEGATPDKIKTWKDIPAMPATAFKELTLTSFPRTRKTKIFKTSGTTLRQGQNSASEKRGAHYFETLKVYDAAILPPFRKHVLKRGSYVFYILISPALEASHSSLSYMMKVVNGKFAHGKSRFYVRQGKPLFKVLAQDLRDEPKRVLFLTTAFALKGFLDYLKEEKIHLCLPSGSRLMETGGFKGRVRELSKRELYRLCRVRLGIKDFVSEYGMTELSSQYYSRNGGPFAAPAWMRAVVMDPYTGKESRSGRVGFLKHVDLANIGSVVAVQTEDLGRMKGKGFEVIGRARGSEARGCSLSYESFLKGTQ